MTRQKLAEQTATINDAGTYVGAGGIGALWGSYPMTTYYGYDAANRLAQVSYPMRYGVAGVTYQDQVAGLAYDEASRLKQMSYSSHTTAQELLDGVQYNAFGQVTSLTTGTNSANPEVEQYGYDAQTGLLTDQKVYNASNMTTPTLDLSYEYNRGNSVGNLSGKTGQLTHISNNLDHNKDRVFEFDALGRLVTAKGGAATGITGPTANWTQAYAYDRYGNKTGVTATGATVGGSNPVPTDGIPTLAYDTSSNRINTSGWQYDNAGNMVRGQNSSGVWQRFEYDAANRLVKVKNDSGNPVETYVYGADRKRLMTGDATTGGRVYVWGGNSVIAEFYTNSGAVYWDKSYFYAGSRLVAAALDIATPYDWIEYYHPDRLGSKLVTNPSANTSYEQSTLPFGTALNAESTGYSNQTFTSYDRSGSTGLDYAVNRTYSSGQGRFTQVDPAGEGLNLYAYVGNDPINYVDPTGLNESVIEYFCYDINTYWHTGNLKFGLTTTTVCSVFGGAGGPGGDHSSSPEHGGGGGGAHGSAPSHSSEKPNCMMNAVPGSPGLARFYDPTNIDAHDGWHVRGPGNVVALPAFEGATVLKITTGSAGGNDKIVDVGLKGGEYVALLKDLVTINVKRNGVLTSGQKIGTVSGGSGWSSLDGLHFAVIRAEYYDDYRRLTPILANPNLGPGNSQYEKAKTTLDSNASKWFIDPLGAGSPFNCSGIKTFVDMPIVKGVPTTYPFGSKPGYLH